jgi:hypothetical protein
MNKISFLTYNNAQQVVKRSKELTEVVPGAVYMVPESETEAELILCLNGVYFSEGTYYPSTIKEQTGAILKHLEEYTGSWKTASWIPTIRIEVMKELGFDAAPLWERREQILAEREHKKQQEQEAKQQRAKQAQMQWEAKMQDCLSCLKEGGKVAIDDFVSLLNFKGIKAHPRTLGLLGKLGRSTEIGVSEALIYGPKRVQLDKVFELAKMIVA